MSARLSSLLVAGGVVLLGGQAISLSAAPASEAALRNATLLGATVESAAGQDLSLNLAVPAFCGTPRLQVLNNPNRVVIDLPGVNRGTQIAKKDMAAWNGNLILKSRLAQFATEPEPVTRLVLEVVEGTQVSVSSSTEGVRVALTKGTGHIQAKLVPFQVPVHTVNAVSMETESVSAKVEPQTVAAPPSENPKLDAVASPATTTTADLPVASAPVSLVSKPVLALNPLPNVGAQFQALPSLAMSSLLPTQPGAVVTEKAPVVAATQVARRDEGRGRTLGDTEARYTGAKMSIDVKGVDINTILRVIADVPHLNLIADTDVQGNFDCKFVDAPWDLVLDMMLKHAGLGKEINSGVIRIAKIEKLQKEEEDRKRLDEAKALAGDLRTVTHPLSFAKSADAKPIVEKVLSKRGSLIIDERTNTLIVTDLPSNLTLIDDLIQQLDVQIQQVQIEARVIEASGGYEKAFGVKWPTSNTGSAKLLIPDPTSTTGATMDAPWVSNNGPSWNSINNRATTGTDASIGFAPGKEGVTSLASPAGEFWVSFLSNRMSVNVILQALEKDGKIKIISSPKVVTQNNKKSKILSGERIPYPSQQGGAQGGAITVAFAQANLELDVTPQITNDGTIIMDLHVTKAEADFSRTVLGTPTILQKEVETQVLVKDGGTAILGGVYTNTESKQMVGVPFLSRLPIIGWLFRTKDDTTKNAELLIFITPRILKS